MLRIVCFGHAGAAMLADEASCVVSSSASKVNSTAAPDPQSTSTPGLASGTREHGDAPTLLDVLVQTVCGTLIRRVRERLLQTSEAAASQVPTPHCLFFLRGWVGECICCLLRPACTHWFVHHHHRHHYYLAVCLFRDGCCVPSPLTDDAPTYRPPTS